MSGKLNQMPEQTFPTVVNDVAESDESACTERGRSRV